MATAKRKSAQSVTLAMEQRQTRLIQRVLAQIMAIFDNKGTEIAYLFAQRKLVGNRFLPKDIAETIKLSANDVAAKTKNELIKGIKQSYVNSHDKNDEIEKLSTNGRKGPPKKPPKVPVSPDGQPNKINTAVDEFIKRKTNGLNLSGRVFKLGKSWQENISETMIDGLKNGTAANKLAKDVRANLRNNKFQMNPGRGVYKDPYKNALRLTRNEINLSYANADHERWKGIDSITGIEVRLSNRHPRYDMCDNLKGKYPKDFRFLPWHVNCLCIAIPVLASQEERDAIMDYKLGLIDRPPGIAQTTELPFSAKQWIADNKDRVAGWKNQPYWIEANKGYYADAVGKTSAIRTVMRRAKESAPEIDKLGNEIAKKYGGTVTPINFKSEESITRKVVGELGGDVSQLKDAVRNTVVVPYKDLDKVVSDLKQDPRFTPGSGGRIKVQDGPEYYGYRGVITNIKTENGLIAEMQVNSAGMIYAKVPKNEALFVMDEKTYNKIAKDSGLPGGRGHHFYEEIRAFKPKMDAGTITPEEIKKMTGLIAESIEYYSKFYKY